MAQEASEKISPAKQAAKRVGTDLNAKWRIDKVLGVGGMGAVFAATHRNHGTRAAIKVLHVEYARVNEVRDRFLREGRIANRVDHPARVPVIDDGLSEQGEPFLVMDLLEGMTLAELFKKGGGRMPVEKLLAVFETVLELLEKCHEIGIIHRDIKPANIFLTKGSEVKVLDFGVARMREPDAGAEATRAGIALGTASFIAPEQALGMDKVDGRADLFSVGACLYTGLTGERLHASKTEAEEFVRAATQAAPSVARKVKDLPLEVAAFVDKALAYDRAQRFQSAKEMRTELLKVLAALRSGKARAARKNATGLVVRGNDAIEEGPELSEIELREQTQRLQSIFKQLGLAMASVRQYGLAHPQTVRALAQGYGEIGQALAQSPYSVRWDVMSGAFMFEGQPVWAPDRVPFDRIPHQLFADGIRKVQFKVGLEEEELRDFMAILLRDVSAIFGAEDDSVTALWDRRFEHVAYLAVDSFAEGDNLEPDRLADWNALAEQALNLTRIDKDFDEAGLEEQALEINLLNRIREAGEAAASLALDPATKATLGAQLAVPNERWLERFVDAFVPAYLDSRRRGDVELLHKAMRDWTADQVQMHAVDKVFEWHELLTRAFKEQLPPEEANDVVLQTAQVVFPLDVLRALMTEISSERKAGWGESAQAAASPKELVAGLGRALHMLTSDAVFALACDCLDSARSEALREVLVPYIRRWAPGQEAQLTTMLGRAGPELGKFIIELFVELKTKESLAGIDAAFGNPNIEVRLAALATMGENLGDRAREEITALLDAPDVEIRMRTLDLVASMKVVAFGPVLVRRIQSDAFHDLSVEERRKLLGAVTVLKAERGEALAVELLSKRRLLTTESTEQSRAVAAEVLAAFESTETIEALRVAAKQRWGTTATVREAAARALEDIEARQAARAKKSPESRARMEGKA